MLLGTVRKKMEFPEGNNIIEIVMMRFMLDIIRIKKATTLNRRYIIMF